MGDAATQKEVLNGSYGDLPEMENTVVRVFFSSTFTDMTVDRNYLMKNSVPKIRQYCLKKNLDFQIIDYRWGVRDEASIDHSTNDIVLEEVEICKLMSRGPYFVLFLGDKYGSRSIPREIEANEYKILYRTAMKVGCDTVLMNQWYKRDDNAEPAVYYLLPITDVLPNYNNDDPKKSTEREKERREWDSIIEKLTQYLRKAADQAYEENRITKDQRLKYFYSVTEAEATKGIIESDSIRNRVLAYIRNFENINIEDKIAKRFIDLVKDDTAIDQEAKDLRERLKIAKIQPVLLPDETKKDTLYWTPNGVDPEDPDHMEYLVSLGKHFEENMIKMVDYTLKKKIGNREDDELYEEVLHHLHFGQKRLESFCGREEVLEDIRNRMTTVHGGSEDSDLSQNEDESLESDQMEEIGNDDTLENYIENEPENDQATGKPDPYFEEVKSKIALYKERGIIYANGDMDRDVDADPEKNMKLEMIKKCELKEYSHPVILHGESGSGKTSIMAKVAKLSETWFPGSSVIVRFLGTSGNSSSLKDVLCSVLRQILKINNKTLPSFVDLGGDFLYLTQLFESMLNNYDPSQTLVILLDSIDQLRSHDRAHLMNWLPLKLPTNIHLIVSMLPETNGCLQNIRNRLIIEQQFIEIPVLSMNTSDDVITKICQLKNRRLTKPQRRHLMELFVKCARPLYVKLLADRAILWRSSTDVKDFKVGPNVQAAIDMFFDYLEKKNGTEVVEKTFGFLSASQEGLSHTELEDLLSLDDETLQDTYLYHLPPDPDNIRIPPSVISLLMKDTKDYMAFQKSGGKKVVGWYHRQFIEVARRRYLTGKEGKNMCQLLVDYFRGTWYNKHKPLELYKRKKASYPESKRGVPDQPIYFHKECCNVRKLIELPYQMIKCHLFKDFHDEIACSFEWLYAKCKFVSVSAVIEDLKMALTEMDAAGNIDDVESYNDIKIVKQMLSLGSDSIRKDSSNLALQILGQLGLGNTSSDFIKKLVTETKEWSETCDISLLLPLSQCLPPPDGYIKTMIDAQVWHTGDEYDQDFSRVMHLQEHNNILVVLEAVKDHIHDYLSVFDMNDNGSAAFSEKLEVKGTTSVYRPVMNDKFLILGHDKSSDNVFQGGASGHDQLVKTETFAEVNIPNRSECVAVSDKYVVYSSLTQINVCTIGQNITAMSVTRSVQLKVKPEYLVISPDNQFLVVFSEKSLLVLNMETLETLHTSVDEGFSFGSSKLPFHALVHILTTNKMLYRGLGYKDGKFINMLDLATGEKDYSVQHWEHYTADIVSIHPSEKYFAVGLGSTSVTNGDNDKRWYIHRIADGQQVSECTKEFCGCYGVTCLKLFGTDQIFAVTALEFTTLNEIYIFYAGTVDNPLLEVVPCQSLKGHSMEIMQVILSKDENTLYSASQDCTIRVWDVSRVVNEFSDTYLKNGNQLDAATATEDFRKNMKTFSTTAVKISSDNRSVLVGWSDGQFMVKDLNDGGTLYEQNYGKTVTLMLMSKSGEEIIIITKMDDIIILDSQSYELKHKLSSKMAVNCAAEANSILVVGKGGMEAKGKAFNIKNGTMVKEFSLLYSLSQVAINSSGTKIVSTMFDFPLIVPLTTEDETDSAMEDMMQNNDTMMSGSSAVDISPDDQYAFSASTDGGIRVVKMSGQYFMRFDQKSSAVAALFSPDSKCIVSCGFKTIYVWSLADGTLSYKLKKHDDFVISLKFDLTGKYLLTSSRDKKLVMWDFRRGISLATFVAHCQLPLVDLSSDAKHLVFVPEDIADIAILRLNKLLTSIVDGTHKLQITPALLGAQAMALSFSSQKMKQRETTGIGCQIM
ncbi:unnamed protein product [Mytilus edulis]|uniref:NACHT domain-containing protein n=1 Tax=Mytilus edulis TaxID=6550 RepID=A0A8S3R2S2_MYTED|nr:unnamed protein product [Mytilus edulis]